MWQLVILAKDTKALRAAAQDRVIEMITVRESLCAICSLVALCLADLNQPAQAEPAEQPFTLSCEYFVLRRKDGNTVSSGDRTRTFTFVPGDPSRGSYAIGRVYEFEDSQWYDYFITPAGELHIRYDLLDGLNINRYTGIAEFSHGVNPKRNGVTRIGSCRKVPYKNADKKLF
jgi:hypothetical protein